MDGWRGKGEGLRKLAFDMQADILVLNWDNIFDWTWAMAKVPKSIDWVVSREDTTCEMEQGPEAAVEAVSSED